MNTLWRKRGESQSRPRVLAVWAHASKVKRAKFMSIEQTAEPAPRVQYLVLHGEDAQAKWAPRA